jgi:phosphoribosylaminoimidazole-succinocarboxamide synthase
MGTDPRLLRDQCARTLTQTDFSGTRNAREGKVRDSYVSGDRRTIVVTDRVSCFDVVVGTLPFKGQVLNQLAAFWFDKTRAIAPNHLISVPDPCVSVVHELSPLPSSS